ncbi:MAG: hypothetical protein WCC17_09850 [Candidatus Nitrosopolaris sp.]
MTSNVPRTMPHMTRVIGGTAIAITMIFAGLIDSGILAVITSGGSASAVAKLAPNNSAIYLSYSYVCCNTDDSSYCRWHSSHH